MSKITMIRFVKTWFKTKKKPQSKKLTTFAFLGTWKWFLLWMSVWSALVTKNNLSGFLSQCWIWLSPVNIFYATSAHGLSLVKVESPENISKFFLTLSWLLYWLTGWICTMLLDWANLWLSVKTWTQSLTHNQQKHDKLPQQSTVQTLISLY